MPPCLSCSWGECEYNSLKLFFHEGPGFVGSNQIVCRYDVLFSSLPASQKATSSDGQFSPYSSQTISASPVDWRMSGQRESDENDVRQLHYAALPSASLLMTTYYNMTTCSLQVEFPHLLVVLINIGLKCSGLKQLHGSLNQKSTKRAAEQLLFAFQTSMCFWWAAATFTGKSFDFRVNSHHSILAHVASKHTRVPQHVRQRSVYNRRQYTASFEGSASQHGITGTTTLKLWSQLAWWTPPSWRRQLDHPMRRRAGKEQPAPSRDTLSHDDTSNM